MTVYIFDKAHASHILTEILEVPVYGPDQGPHVIHHLDIPDLSCLRKLNIAPIQRHFPEKFTCYENVCHRWFHVILNFQINIWIVY